MRRSDLRVPPVKSRLGRCDFCLKTVWVSASSPKADEIWCLWCAVELAEPYQWVGKPTERQIADIRKALQ
jgi:hypothetical protein